MDVYNQPARYFHWIIGILFLGLLAVGFFMSGLDQEPYRWDLYAVHKATGILVLALVIGRITWRLIKKAPSHVETHQKWERVLSGLIHFLLYGGMLVMPLSGWVMSSAGGHPVMFYGLFEVPAIVGENKQIGAIAREVHDIAGTAILFAIGLHFLGAAKHHILDRDMTVQRIGLVSGFTANMAVLAFMGLLLAAAFAAFLF